MAVMIKGNSNGMGLVATSLVSSPSVITHNLCVLILSDLLLVCFLICKMRPFVTIEMRDKK